MNSKLKLINFLLIIPITVVVFTACKKKEMKNITFTVSMVPLIDSLPAKVQINYSSSAGGEDILFEGTKWNIIKELSTKTNTTLKASGISNVKSIEVRIEGYRNPPSIKGCETTNCSAETTYEIE